MLAEPVWYSIMLLMIPVGGLVSVIMYRAGMDNLRKRVF